MAALVAAMLVAVRPASVLLATLGSEIPVYERLLAAWIAPRGVVAAAFAGLAGGALNGAGYGGSLVVMPAVFALIAASVVLHGMSLRPLARALGLTLGDMPGLAVVGASEWSTEMAAVLHRHGVPVVLVDKFPGALAAARAIGIPILQAEILSEHGEASLANCRVDYIFAATPDAVYNALVCARLAPELGRERVFQLPPESRQPHQRTDIGREARGKVAGWPPIDYDAFEARHQEGWRFTIVSGESAQQAPDAVELLALGESGELSFVSVEGAASPARRGTGPILVFAPPASDMLPARTG